MEFSEGRRPIGRRVRRAGFAAALVSAALMGVVAAPAGAADGEPDFGLPTEVAPPEVIGPVTSLRVNFQDTGLDPVPGWASDTGEPFDPVRGYGWRGVGDRVQRRQCAHRSVHPDPVLDSFCHAQNRYFLADGAWRSVEVPATWEAALAVGTYEVTVTMGEPAHFSSTVRNHLMVEGVVAIDGFVPNRLERHRSMTVVVDVLDGFVTLDPRAGVSSRIAAVEIEPHVEERSELPDPVLVSFQPDGAVAPAGWRADSGRPYSFDVGYGWRGPDGAMAAPRQCGMRPTPAAAGLDTFCHAQTRYELGPDGWTAIDSPAIWEVAVPRGSYDVTIVMGESLHAFASVVNSIAVEGLVVIDGFVATADRRQLEVTVRVRVDDGFLTLDPRIGTRGKLAAVAIVPHVGGGTAS